MVTIFFGITQCLHNQSILLDIAKHLRKRRFVFIRKPESNIIYNLLCSYLLKITGRWSERNSAQFRNACIDFRSCTKDSKPTGIKGHNVLLQQTQTNINSCTFEQINCDRSLSFFFSSGYYFLALLTWLF